MSDWASRGARAAAATSVTAIQDSTAAQDPLPEGGAAPSAPGRALLRGPQGALAPRPQSRQRAGGRARGFRQKVEALCRALVPRRGVAPCFLPSAPPPSPAPPPLCRGERGPSGSAPAPGMEPGSPRSPNSQLGASSFRGC